MPRAPRSDKITVVGEGLVGSLLSIGLRRRGFEVEVYERRGDPRAGKAAAGRSINLALSARGLHALKELGLDQKVLSRAIPMYGRMIHPLSAETSLQPYGRDPSEHINSISRGWLNAVLMEEAESLGASIHFERRAVSYDFKTGTLGLRDTAGRTLERRAPVVIGADGAGSAIRQEIMNLPRTRYSQEYLEHGYKELSIPPGPGGSFQLEKNALHIWPRGRYMLIALPNFDGSFTCTLFLPFEGPLSFEALDGPDKVLSFFSRQFPDALALMPHLAEEFFANPTGHMVMLRCLPWHAGGQALLIGDAAHAMVPFYGQGMNCGFEDCSVLWECLDQEPPRRGSAPGAAAWGALFERFTRLRKPNADAISEMALENFVEMRDKVAQPRFQLEKKVERLLQERFPERYIPRYSLVTFSRVPYRLAQRAGEIQARLLSQLCEGLSRAEDVDWAKAESLIGRELAPLLDDEQVQAGLATHARLS
ncbi:MAG: FAD-dependent monooxygenase [Elusimicrobia bacterium]|nr:FAD-dependent monooxygenase [Elusimicrobiota bacterium]